MKIPGLPREWCVAVVVVVAAASASATATDQPSPAFDSLSYRDSGGFAGGGTGKSLSLSPDGRVLALGRGGTRSEMRLSPGDLAALDAAIAAVDWPHVEHAYQMPGAADLIVRDLVVVVRGTKYETHADSLSKLPPPLRAVFARLDDFYSRAIKPTR